MLWNTIATSLCILLLSALLSCSAYPYFWYDSSLRPPEYSFEKEPTCVEHPADPGAHGVPEPDRSITFTFYDTITGSASAALCPGAEYTIRLTFEEERLALLTADPANSTTFSTPAPTPGCPNRVSFLVQRAAFKANFTVPCSSEGSSILFKTTSVGASKRWLQNSITVDVASLQAASGSGCAAKSASCLASRSIEADQPSQSPSSPSAPSPPFPSPPPPAQPFSPPPPLLSACVPSPLGYECMVTQGKVTIHWTLNTPSAPPNECTPETKTVLQSEELATNGSLHVAVQASVRGYVALGFSNDPDKMAPADIALGWAGATGADAYFNTFHVMEEDLDESNIHPPLGTPSWAYDRGVVRDATSGITTVCFSRLLKDSRALESGDLKAVLAAASAGGSQHRSLLTSDTQQSRRRLAHANHVTLSDPDEEEEGATGKLGFIWAVSDERALVEHLGWNVGGFWLDPASGSALEPEGRGKRFWINVHGALMAVAWGLLLPLGTMFPAHRWLMGGRKCFGQQLWFVLHSSTQWTGMILFIAGFIVAFTKLEGGGSGEVKEAHENIGIAIMAAAGAQVVLAFVRPAPPSPGETLSDLRRAWNLVHHNLGRAVVLLAWANVYIGIYVYHNSIWAASYTPWITPIAIVMGLLVIADVALRMSGPSAAPSKYDVSKEADLATNNGSISNNPVPMPFNTQPEAVLKAQAT